MNKWILPEGVEDILPEQAIWLEEKRRKIIDTFISSGYNLIITPLIEFTDSLLLDNSSDLDIQTFKVTDQYSGKQLGIRADITTQIIRSYISNKEKNSIGKFCYFDHVLRTRNNNNQSRIPIQVGAELLGQSGIESDAEIIILMINVLKSITGKKIFLDLGHVGIYKYLIEKGDISKNEKSDIFNLIKAKSSTELKNYIQKTSINGDLKNALIALPRMHGNIENIEADTEILFSFGDEVTNKINYLKNLSSLIIETHNDITIKYDLCEFKGFDYENELVFSAFFEDSTDQFAVGGRYDGLIDKIQGVGFSFDIRRLLKSS
ncbi:MAG: ATP phosphoribosyltransferase regulatory subunit [Gammaproteobacteria bacterium]|nr:ATP phosphoribosyltransferase regulatory subunit [Gammaproteobacteria bacterium]|tara:strand:+ start:7863 stop:8822 length:960 start_codon:yes stop_codon:yes gene_type:complete